MRIDTVNRDPTPVIYAASSGDWQSIPEAAARAFALLETAITPHGRKIYGYWHPPLLEYRACYASEAGDVAPTVGLRETVIPGGRYRGAAARRRRRIRPNPRGIRDPRG